jgi:hypothetical protein
MIITENQLDQWVRANKREAQGTIVELVTRLVAASCPGARERRFPLSDSINQPGPDGFLDTDVPCPPFVPDGRSYWEIGTGENANEKATSDYRTRTAETPPAERVQSSFVFVTPLSSARQWSHTWKKNGQRQWIHERSEKNEWRGIYVVDGTKLVDWIQHWPAVGLWMATKMGIRVERIETLEQCWSLIRTYGEPPPLTHHVFLANRAGVLPKIEAIFNGTSSRLTLKSHYRKQTAHVVSAWLQTLDQNLQREYGSRCLIVDSSTDLRGIIDSLEKPHILVADVHLEDLADEGAELIQRIHQSRHSLIIGGSLGGIPEPCGVTLPSPRSIHIREALRQANYAEERARVISQKCDGNLPTLLRLLQNLSFMPEWSQRNEASDLAIAQFLGSWKEDCEADCKAAEAILGKAYGEWVGRLRSMAAIPDTPLILHNGVWRITARYEVWHALGSRICDDDLDRLRSVAVTVLQEDDPQFDLEPDERYAAALHGKVRSHSSVLRKGIAETLALLGSYPNALSSCTSGKAEAMAALAVRELLSNADWLRWASLNDLLPLLAEASPDEFLKAVKGALQKAPSPFDQVFGQESGGLFGRNYMTGLLWALETLAWDADYLTRVVMILGELTMRDPGGNWGNRPIKSLSNILLPWLPQTCASIERRVVAVEMLFRELPDIAWKLTLSLLPSTSQYSMGTRRPAWRSTIPEDFVSGATKLDYWQQVLKYSEQALSAAKGQITKLADLIERFRDLPEPTGNQLLDYLSSEEVTSLLEAERVKLWTELTSLVSRHKKHADAEWAMSSERVTKVSDAAYHLAPQSPFYRYQRLFTDRDFDLFEERGSFEEQQRQLDALREDAVRAVFEEGGIASVLNFARVVESPWIAGFACGSGRLVEVESQVLPVLLESPEKQLSLFAGGLVKGSFHRMMWEWADRIDFTSWSASQKGQFLAYLPFATQTWNRVAAILGHDESPYWSRTTANAHQSKEDIPHAVDRLVEHSRPFDAVECLAVMLFRKEPINGKQASRVLQACINLDTVPQSLRIHSVVKVIEAVQKDPDVNPSDIMKVEWAFLPLLHELPDASPRFLERRLAEDPSFFCEIIRTLFRSEKEDKPEEPASGEHQFHLRNAYRLLMEWKRPPGTSRDGAFSGDQLNEWIGIVRKVSSESGHLKVAEQKIGEVLIHSPADVDGFWVHRSVAEALNAKDADEMRLGFRIGLFNSRGATLSSAGREESKLAFVYRDRANQLYQLGYHRLADTIGQLAKEYDHMAERMSSEDLLEDS